VNVSPSLTALYWSAAPSADKLEQLVAIVLTGQIKKGAHMFDEDYERYAKSAAEAAARAAFEKGMEVGLERGFSNGMAAGQLIGFVAGVQSLASALSDGTRKGSSECGRALESLKRISAISKQDDQTERD